MLPTLQQTKKHNIHCAWHTNHYRCRETAQGEKDAEEYRVHCTASAILVHHTHTHSLFLHHIIMRALPFLFL